MLIFVARRLRARVMAYKAKSWEMNRYDEGAEVKKAACRACLVARRTRNSK